MSFKLLNITRLLFAGLLILLFDVSLQQTLLAQAQPETCHPDAVMIDTWPGTEGARLMYQSLSADGRYTVFATSYRYPPFVSHDYIGRYDRLTCETEIVVSADDGEPTTPMMRLIEPVISADGRYVVFSDILRQPRLFLRDMQTQEITPIPDSNDAIAPAISADGRYIVYATHQPVYNPTIAASLGVYLYDRVQDETTEIVSGGQRAGGGAVYYHSTISADGQFIAFYSNADNLVEGDTDVGGDVFLYEVATGNLNRISTGAEVPHLPAISGDGRFVVFHANGSEIAPDDPNHVQHVFVYDRLTGDVEQVSVASDGSEGNYNSGDHRSGISGDGRYITFASQATNLHPGVSSGTHIYVLDRTTNLLKLVTVTPDGEPTSLGGMMPVMSDDGLSVAFLTYDSTSTPANVAEDILLFLADWQQLPVALPGVLQPETCDPDASVTVLLRNPDNFESDVRLPFISDDGRYVVYSFHPEISETWRSIPYRYDRVTCETKIISITGDSVAYGSNSGTAAAYGLSADGRYVLFNYNTQDGVLNGWYVQDMNTGLVERIPAENAYPVSLSSDGRFVLYGAANPDLSNNPSLDRNSLFLYDRTTDETEVIASAVEGDIYALFLTTMPEDNSLIVFASDANLLVPEDTDDLTDIFVYDRSTEEFTRISTGIDGEPTFDESISFAAVSEDGRYIVYTSVAHNLVVGDTNNKRDIFVYDRNTSTTRRVSVAEDGTEGNGNSGDSYANISADGRFIAFSSDATNLIVGETHNTRGIYVYDQLTDDIWSVGVDDYYSDGIISNADPMLSRDGQWLAYATSQQVGAQYGVDLFIVEWQTLVDGGIEEPTPSEPDAAPQRNVVISGESLLIWSEITWAVAYEIQIDNDADFSSPVSSDNALSDTYLIVPDLPNGVFYWRVRAQRSNGSWGGWSAVDSIVVGAP